MGSRGFLYNWAESNKLIFLTNESLIVEDLVSESDQFQSCYYTKLALAIGYRNGRRSVVVKLYYIHDD